MHTSNIRKRDKVTGGGDGAPQRQLGCHLAIEQLLHSLKNLPPDSREALQQRVRAHQHGGSRRSHRQRVAGVHHTRIQKPETNNKKIQLIRIDQHSQLETGNVLCGMNTIEVSLKART